jgi:hypothetical protein
MTAPPDTPPRFRPRPWIHLETPQDVELWIAEHDQALQDLIKPQETGYGVCFTLAEGGNIYLQTHEDAIQLDVDDEASWVAPLIVAATGAEIPRGSSWSSACRAWSPARPSSSATASARAGKRTLTEASFPRPAARFSVIKATFAF